MAKKINKQIAKAPDFTKARIIPSIASTLSINQIYKTDQLDILALSELLKKQQINVIEGKTDYLEAVLISQIQTLQAIFHYASERITQAESLTAMQDYSDLAMKANNCCRKTILGVNQLKNPSPATFIKQQNNAINQQVVTDRDHNNSAPRKLKKPNELLSEIKHETLDFGRTTETIPINSQVESVAKINRSKDP